MSEIDRLYSYRTLLTGRRAVPREEILSKLEISPATFKRDLAKLRDRLNIPVVFDRDLGGYRLDNRDPRQELPGLWFSQDEIMALLTIQNMLEQLEPSLLGPKLKPLQQRLDDMLAGQGLSAETLSQRVRLVHAGKRRLKLKCFELVAKATLERKQIKIQHFNRQTGQTVGRVISPQKMVHYRDNWYVDAWCHLRREVRSFAVYAIVECEQLTEDAKELDADLLRTSMQSGYGIFGGAVKGWAKLKFSPERARWVKQEEWHAEQKARELTDGSYVLEIPYSDERELVGDILRFGSDVQVISPNSLRNQVLTELEKSVSEYRLGTCNPSCTDS
jgi:predicted DNA-binding transcriptional regulator YafY